MDTSARPRGYGFSTTIGAILATVFFPIIALAIALIMLGNESDPEKRAFLRSWAWISGLWLIVPVVLLSFLASARL